MHDTIQVNGHEAWQEGSFVFMGFFFFYFSVLGIELRDSHLVSTLPLEPHAQFSLWVFKYGGQVQTQAVGQTIIFLPFLKNAYSEVSGYELTKTYISRHSSVKEH
jgi:hypothetical protein